MMTTLTGLAPLLLALGSAGVELSLFPDDAGRLRFRPVVIAPELIERLRAQRAAILALLGDPCAPTDADAGYVYGERLGAADGLGMPTHPGSPAWSVAVGESLTVLLAQTNTIV
jgi:hypothetical protein